MDANPPPDPSAEHQAPIERLWTPWRMRYIGGGAKEDGCLFCNRLAADDDVRSLILHRDDLAFIIMNLFPYNTGHVMIVPNEHVSTPEAADPATLERMGALLKPTLRALRRVLNSDGFNVGMNVGAVAGAGVADHLHQHLVPRWQGDANFMPILASTMVLPELIPVTYAKLRAELAREFSGRADSPTDVTLVVFTEDRSMVLLDVGDGSSALPTATANPGQALWRAAGDHLTGRVSGAVLAGWAGPARTATPEPPALTFFASPQATADGSLRFETIEQARSLLKQDSDRHTVSEAIANLAMSQT
jgi:ATP adenylyltransferase